jgi:D-amino-acid dehydrogenase
MHVLVIGAGIVGCATAYQLLRDGHTVELVDAQPQAGRVSSFANGAQLSYSYVEPLASPATLCALPKLLFEKDAALRFLPKLDWRQWAWGLRFLRACTQAQAQRGTRELLTLAALSRATLEAWMQEEDWAFDFSRNGKLVLCPDEAGLERQRAQVALQAQLGSEQQVLTREQCVAHAPVLAGMTAQFAGGVWTASECVADPYKLCQALVRSIEQRGGVLRMAHRVQAFELHKNRFQALHTDHGKLSADACVIAAGVASVPLAAQLGMHLPIYPIKGYSITVPVTQPERLAACSITDLGLKTVFAPLGQDQGQAQRLRVAAAAELVGHGMHIPEQRVQQMLTAVERLFPGACDVSAPQIWAGLRPATPTSIPIIGASRVRNVYINAGQGALGLTLAAGSAARLAAQIKAAT